MKGLLAYWLIGCFVIGIPTGATLRECPKSKFVTADALAATALWPLVIVAAIVMGKTDRPTCENQ